MPDSIRHTAWRKLPEDEFYLQAICRKSGLNQASVIRLAIREFAHRHGYVLREYQDILLLLDKFATESQNDKLKLRAKKHLKQNLEFILDFEDVPEDLMRDALFTELLSRYRRRVKVSRRKI